MKKFAIEWVKGDDVTIIQTFNTKDDAMDFGQKHYADLSEDSGILCCLAADFDDKDQRTNNVSWIYHVWRLRATTGK